MKNLELEIKQLIIEALNLEDITPDDIDSKSPIFGEGLGLDSIDALELGIEIKKKYNIQFSTDDATNKKHFASVSNLAKFVEENKR